MNYVVLGCIAQPLEDFWSQGQQTQSEQGESSKNAMTRISLEQQVTALQQQLSIMVEYVKQFMPESALNNLPMTPRRTQGTGASATDHARIIISENLDANIAGEPEEMPQAYLHIHDPNPNQYPKGMNPTFKMTMMERVIKMLLIEKNVSLFSLLYVKDNFLYV